MGGEHGGGRRRANKDPCGRTLAVALETSHSPQGSPDLETQILHDPGQTPTASEPQSPLILHLQGEGSMRKEKRSGLPEERLPHKCKVSFP